MQHYKIRNTKLRLNGIITELTYLAGWVRCTAGKCKEYVTNRYSHWSYSNNMGTCSHYKDRMLHVKGSKITKWMASLKRTKLMKMYGFKYKEPK